jgi:hypothetical protein
MNCLATIILSLRDNAMPGGIYRLPSSLQEVSKIREKVKNFAVSPPERRRDSFILKGIYRFLDALNTPDFIL